MNHLKYIRLFIFHPYSSLGGADRSLARLINGLENKKYKIIFISINSPKIKKLINRKVKYIKLNSRRTITSIFEVRKILFKLTKNNINTKNIFISNQNFANSIFYFILFGLSNFKSIIVERNHLNELNYSKNLSQKIKNQIIKLLIKLNYKKADQIIGISKKLSEDLQKFCKAKVNTIYNPAYDEEILKNFKKQKFLKKKFSSKTKFLLNVGFLENQKDHITLLKAIKLVKDKYANIHLIIIGKGSKFELLNNFILNNNLKKNVTILQNVNNPKIFYQNSNLFVLSSVYEGFGNVLVEALRNNCPVISSNCYSGPKEILKNGKYGDLFKPGDAKSLANKIINFLNYPNKLKKKLIEGKKDLSRFSVKQNIKSYKNLFNKI